MCRQSVAALSITSLLLLTPCTLALAAVDFSGRAALSTDTAGQSFLQVNIGPLSNVQSLQRVEDYETRLSALLDAEWRYSISESHRLLLENRLLYGSTVARDRLNFSYRYRGPNGSKLDLDSETDLEEGEVFDRDETDVRQAAVARWTRPLGSSRNRVEAYGRAEVRRVSGDTLFFPQSHNLGKARVTWFRDLGLLSSFNVGYVVEAVAAVDSAPGSYVEHGIESALDLYAGSSFHASGEVIAARRDYVNSDSSSATGWGLLSQASVRYSPSLSLDVEAKPALEVARHDRPDFVYFDYDKAGLELGLKARPIDEVGLEIFPGTEMLRAPDAEREDYDQFHVSLGADVMAPGLWLDVSYKVGRRDYASPAPRDDLESIPRSDYVFGDLLLLAEKALWGPLTVRVTASHSVEWHELKEDDVTVFLLSSEISYRF